jgi:hypothetical protein
MSAMALDAALFRDQAAERFEVHTGSPWHPARARWSTIARSRPR